MSTYKLLDFKDIVDAVCEELKLQSTDTVSRNRIKRDINTIYIDEVVPFSRWKWLQGEATVAIPQAIQDSTVAVTQNDTAITFVVAPAASVKNRRFAVQGQSEIYTIATHTAGATSATLDRPYNSATAAATPYKVWADNVALPAAARETVEAWHDFMAPTMEGRGLQDFRKIQNGSAMATGRPVYYYTGAFTDPTPNDAETESDRQRAIWVHPAIFTGVTNLHVSYTKDVVALEDDGDEPVLPVEDRIVLLYGALSRAWRRERNPDEAAANYQLFSAKLARMAGKVEDTLDKPSLSPESRYISSKRARMGSSASRGVIGGSSYGGGAPTVTYLEGTTIHGASITDDVIVSAGKLIDGRDLSEDGGALDGVVADLAAHIADPTDAHDASAISNTTSGNLTSTNVQAALEELQNDVDGKVSQALLDAHINDTSAAHAASAIGNTAAGNLAATDVQAALNELQTDVDTRALAADLTAHISDTTAAHAASAIANIPSGNLAATDVQAALNELQSDIDLRLLASLKGAINGVAELDSGGKVPTAQLPALALTDVSVVASQVAQLALTAEEGDVAVRTDSERTYIHNGGVAGTMADWSEITTPTATSLASHISATAAHGVSGNVVGTTDSQTLTNKTLTAPTADIVVWDDQASAPANPSSGFYKTYFKTDGKMYKLDSSGVETEIGSGGSARDQSYELSNVSLAASVGSSALTIALKDKSGSNPSGGSPVLIGFRNATAAAGTYSQVSVTSSLSLTISSGSTLGTASGVSSYVYVYAIDNAGTAELAVSRAWYDSGSVITTTAEGGAGAADSASTIYSTTARSNVPIRLIGRLLQSQTTAGTWASVPTEIALLPFDRIPVVAEYTANSGQTVGNSGAVLIDFFTKVTDTLGNAVTIGGSWEFKAPEAGQYRVSAQLKFTATLVNPVMILYKNGSGFRNLDNRFDTSGLTNLNGSTTVTLAKDDTLKIYAYHESAGNKNLASDAKDVWVTIEKIR